MAQRIEAILNANPVSVAAGSTVKGRLVTNQGITDVPVHSGRSSLVLFSDAVGKGRKRFVAGLFVDAVFDTSTRKLHCCRRGSRRIFRYVLCLSDNCRLSGGTKVKRYLLTIVLLALASCEPTYAAGTVVDRAKPYLQTLSSVITTYWATAPGRPIMAGKIEQESSWKERATLKTSRELGRGLGQLTITYRADGTERFNIYRDAVKMKALKDWNWHEDPYNVRYQLTFSVLTDRSNFFTVRPYAVNDYQAWKMALVCYNAGQGRWLSRRHNAKVRNIPADRWDGGLDQAYSSGEAKLLYGRPLYEAVNEYPRVIFSRSHKYQGML